MQNECPSSLGEAGGPGGPKKPGLADRTSDQGKEAGPKPRTVGCSVRKRFKNDGLACCKSAEKFFLKALLLKMPAFKVDQNRIKTAKNTFSTIDLF